LVGHIDNLGAEDVTNLDDLSALVTIRSNLEQEQFTRGELTMVQIIDLHHLHELVELLDALIELLVVTTHRGGDTRKLRVVRRPYIESVDVEAAPAEHASHARKDTKFVFNKYG